MPEVTQPGLGLRTPGQVLLLPELLSFYTNVADQDSATSAPQILNQAPLPSPHSSWELVSPLWACPWYALTHQDYLSSLVLSYLPLCHNPWNSSISSSVRNFPRCLFSLSLLRPLYMDFYLPLDSTSLLCRIDICGVAPGHMNPTGRTVGCTCSQ